MYNFFKKSYIIPAYCTDGEVRLDEGETAWEGRVELCMNGRWGTVGGNKWNQINSRVVCNSLGYDFTGKLEDIIIIAKK